MAKDNKNKQNILFNPVLWLTIALTLGLMPYTPEPHLWEKLKWIAAGAEEMQSSDWFDFIMHGTPWLFLIASIIRKLYKT